MAQEPTSEDTTPNAVQAGSDTPGSPALAQAYQVLAHSSALAIQDAVAHMRNMNSISATAAGTALAQMLSTGDVATYAQVIEQTNALQANSINHFKTIAEAASDLLRNFPQAPP